MEHKMLSYIVIAPPPQSNKKGEITRERVIILEGDIHSFEFEWRLPNVKL